MCKLIFTAVSLKEAVSEGDNVRTESFDWKAALILLVLIFGAFLPVAAHAQATVTQSFDLHPGWNSIYLEVQPEPSDPAGVFGGISVDSVWMWSEKNSSVEFIVDPGEKEWDQRGWLAYFGSPEEAFLTTLFAVNANNAYLVKVNGTEPVTLEVTGTPSVRPITWVPDSFNLTGFHIDPASPPDFGSFFAPSKAHGGKAVYRLNGTGRWEFINSPSTTQMRSGEAYWVYCQGGSKYQGPIAVEAGQYKGLDFGRGLNELTVKITNNTGGSRTVGIVQLPSADPVALEYKNFNQSNQTYEWNALSGMSPVTVSAGKTHTLTLGVRREAMGAGASESVLEFKDGSGVRIFVPVSAKK